MAYALAGDMGIGPQGVDWKRLPESEALSRGDHPFDVYLGQVAITAGRRRLVDLSRSYYQLDQALVAPASSAAASATSRSAIAKLKLGVAAGSDSAVYVHDVIGETRSRSAAKGPDAKGSSTAASDHDAETATAAHPT